MNESHDNISEELLARYLADEASSEEITEVNAWLARSPLHEQELATYRLIWNHAASAHKKIQVDSDAAWNSLKSKMNAKTNAIPGDQKDFETKEIELNTQQTATRKFPFRMLAAAMVAILLLTFGWFFMQSNKESIQVATTNNTKEQILPDGTKVFLNYNSTLTYPEEFDGDFRTVSLQGEAFFDVKRDTEHPFIIDAEGTKIQVLGTSFNIKAYKKAPVRVDVATGKVEVSKAGKKIQLSKGESAEVSDTIRSLRADMNRIGYRTQVYDFNAANLNDVIESIKDGYHVDVRLTNQQIAQCRLTIRFEKEPLDATLAVIAETLDLDLRKEGKVYWFDGDGCQ